MCLLADHYVKRRYRMRPNSPRPTSRQSTPIASNVRATVKWFNPTKGFGFVAPEDGSADAFLHISVIEMIGHDSLPEGATVVVDLDQGQKGPQVSAVHDVDLSTAAPSRGPSSSGPRAGGFGGGAPRSGGRSFDRDFDNGPTTETDGTVKWFNTEKGFGFIAPSNGGKDVFVHISAVERSGFGSLAEGESVRVEVRQGAKGPEAVSLRRS
jgi:CspA family cold shock protein